MSNAYTDTWKRLHFTLCDASDLASDLAAIDGRDTDAEWVDVTLRKLARTVGSMAVYAEKVG